ncbi:putative membrane spanning protein [Geobacillus sp. WSUCF1]|nr:putative membrane spanning protein [Geobacillus sp. WSUCF1]
MKLVFLLPRKKTCNISIWNVVGGETLSRVYVDRFLRFFLVIAAVALGAIAAYYIATVTYPFIIAFFIAMIINPLVDALERKAKMPRWLAVSVTLIMLFAAVAGLVTLLVAEIVSGTQYLARVVPEKFQALITYMETFVADQIIPIYKDLAGMFKSLSAAQQDTIMQNIQAVGKKMGTTVGEFVQSILQNIPQLLAWLPNAATVFIFSLLATFFISKDWRRLVRMAQQWLPTKARTSGKTVFLDLKRALFGFIKAQATLISITTVIVLIGLLILRVDYAITIALIIGFVDLLPYLGTGIVFVPWIIYTMLAATFRLPSDWACCMSSSSSNGKSWSRKCFLQRSASIRSPRSSPCSSASNCSAFSA